MDLSIRDITYCKGVGTRRADIFRKELKVQTALDLLRYYPYKYIDRSRFISIADIEDDETYIQIKGEITEFHTIGIGRGQRLSATFSDGRHTMELVWFRQIQYVKLLLHTPYLLFGKPSRFNHAWNMVHPELTPLEKVRPETTQGLEASYSMTEKMRQSGLNSKAIRSILLNMKDDILSGIPETLGMDVVNHFHLMGLTEALWNIHFPKDTSSMQRARERLKFEELFYIQLQLLRQMHRREQNAGFLMPKVGTFFHSFYRDCLPFSLTGAQKRVVHEIQDDLKSGRQMNRLLQGDVGSGKTLVALLCALLAADNGYQTCIMAPTEILAQQHLETLKSLLKDLPVRVELLTGSVTKKQREPLHEALRMGDVHILIGTHALLEDEVEFANLGLCIIDEQHRFGVAQRAKLWAKNILPPHILVMTATPIPRTLAMTLYGDLRVSVIDELPPGRKPVHTLHYSLERRRSVYQFMQQQIDLGRQIYVVFPLIKENESLDLKDLQNGYNELCEAFPTLRISMVHGQMKNRDKDEQMRRFTSGETQILVATTVIEVGVNVPNASVMVIMNAERFGLSQLHQLRG
ncbi:MAG: ATP-dependent DNA helicase RecG, partial [Paludibacteraceae bacterium]|nr:ATP-dependent DNA helicase RecG [Paludibacteraceae bacterium]